MNTRIVTTATARKPALLLLITYLSLTLSGCAIMSKKDCLQGNWQDAGYHDASRGHTDNRFALRTRACAKHDITSDKAAYQTGYNAGLQTYCLPENAIRIGIRNADYRDICPADLQQGFLENYIAGLQIAHKDVVLRYREVDNDLFSARFRRSTLKDDQSEHKEKINRRIERLSNGLDSLRTVRLEIRHKIQRWQARL